MNTAAADFQYYRPVRLDCQSTGRILTAIREFSLQGKKQYLLVNPDTLETQIKSASSLRCTAHRSGESTYLRAVEKMTRNSRAVDGNHGLKQFSPRCAPGTVLTIDMCPTSKPYDADYFQAIAKMVQKSSTPVAITIAVTGKRMADRPQEMSDIKRILGPLERQGRLKITWANHSHSHPYKHGESYYKTFLTGVGEREFTENEVLGTEKAMIQNGLTPSVFFRFPGLMSTPGQIQKLGQLGLIPLGTTAWLAMHGSQSKYHKIYHLKSDQGAEPGRIVLTHGNGMERVGVDMAKTYLHSPHRLLPLEQAAACEAGTATVVKDQARTQPTAPEPTPTASSTTRRRPLGTGGFFLPGVTR